MQWVFVNLLMTLSEKACHSLQSGEALQCTWTRTVSLRFWVWVVSSLATLLVSSGLHRRNEQPWPSSLSPTTFRSLTRPLSALVKKWNQRPEEQNEIGLHGAYVESANRWHSTPKSCLNTWHWCWFRILKHFDHMPYVIHKSRILQIHAGNV